MTRYERLRREALASCKYRGHQMGKFRKVYDSRGVIGISECPFCGKQVHVRPDPAPNDIEIGGEAVAIGC